MHSLQKEKKEITGSIPMFISVLQDWYFLFPLALSQKLTPPHYVKLPAVTHVPFFKLRTKWRHFDALLLDRFPQKKTIVHYFQWFENKLIWT